MTEGQENPTPRVSMEEWIKEDDPHKDDPVHCRPCRLGVIGSWYKNELEEQGHKDLGALIEVVASDEKNPDMPLTLCQTFDRIKSVVEEPLRERLKEFDQATQSFNPDEVVEDSTAAEEND